MSTFLQGIAKKAQEQPKHRFGNLYELLNEEYLEECWSGIRKNAAYGVDRVSAEEYEQHLKENIHDLVERLKRKQYRAKLVRRQYIPKGDGKQRPLGIPAVEDKLLQLAVTRILQAIYEQDFLRCSYGYRPNIGALDAVSKLTVKLQFGQYHYVVEADIQGFFDNIQHDWMVEMLKERVEDGAFLRLIQKWLVVGVLDTNGQVLHPVTGTPQGGIVSPVLANVYLHYALDLWFQKVMKPLCKGEACLIRYADDFVCAFEYQAEAERFHQMLGERLGKFGLALSAEKTRIIRFSSQGPLGNSSFDFLGFEFRWGRDRAGKPRVKRRTARKKLKKSWLLLAVWCRAKRDLLEKDLFRELNAKLRGYYNYYGVIGNFRSLNRFFQVAMRLLYKWLNRRSQRKSVTWAEFRVLLHLHGVEYPRIVERPRLRPVASAA
jgi:group II intron reverse transcriptase/maturase